MGSNSSRKRSSSRTKESIAETVPTETAFEGREETTKEAVGEAIEGSRTTAEAAEAAVSKSVLPNSFSLTSPCLGDVQGLNIHRTLLDPSDPNVHGLGNVRDLNIPLTP